MSMLLASRWAEIAGQLSDRRQFSASSDARSRSAPVSDLVASAVRRIASQRVRPNFLRRHSRILVLGIASVVAVRTLNLRREYEEEITFAQARAVRLETERDEARELLSNAKQRLVAEIPAAVGALKSGARSKVSAAEHDARVAWMKKWIDTAFESPRSQEGASQSNESHDRAVSEASKSPLKQTESGKRGPMMI